MSSMRITRALAGAVLAALLLPAVPLAPPADGAPAPLAITPPFALPALEGPNVKVEIGVQTPSGPATSFIGSQPAQAYFTIWWWDTAPAMQADLFVDGIRYPMSVVPGGDGDDTNGTQYFARVPIAGLSVGDHSYSFDFIGGTAQVRFPAPAAGNLTNLRLDRADRFLTDLMIQNMRQVRQSYPGGGLATLRDVVARVAQTLDAQVGTHWDNTDGYLYADKNRFIIEPTGATATNREAFVNGQGATRVRYTDPGNFSNNSQPAIKQAYLMRGGLLATGLFNESDIEVYTEDMLVNITPYGHPYLRVRLNDGSELAGDGTTDGDGWMDVDLWALGLSPQVAVGQHFGEDFDTDDDQPWNGTIGWPQQADSNTDIVLSQYQNVRNVTAPDGSRIDFYTWVSSVTANTMAPVAFATYDTSSPLLFSAVNSVQSNGLDLQIDWQVLNGGQIGVGPVWTTSIPVVGQYTVALNVQDGFGETDSINIVFRLRGSTVLVQPIPDVTMLEDGRHALDLRVFFSDADGFGTITFNFAVDPVGTVDIDRFPALSPTLNLTVAPDWCGVAVVTVTATDGLTPPIIEPFNVTVTCVNDRPFVSLPASLTWDEDTPGLLGPMAQYVLDNDTTDTLTWSFGGSLQVAGAYFAGNDTFVFTPPRDWHGAISVTIGLTDGAVFENRSILLIVEGVNDAPVMNLQPTIVVPEDAPEQNFALADYFTDPDGEPLSAVITPFPGIEAEFSVVLKSVTYKPAADYYGTTAFEMRVFDAANAGINVTVVVIVTPVNDAPVISKVTPSGYVSASEGSLLQFVAEVSDPDNATHIFSWEVDAVSKGQNFDGKFNWTADYQSAGRHTVKVTACDTLGLCVEHTWQLQIAQTNRPPTASIVRPPAATFKPGESIALSALAADGDGDALSYTWSFGGQMQPMTGQNITVKFNAAGLYTVRLTVSDGQGQAVVTTDIEVVYTVPTGNCTANCTPPPPPPPPTPGFELALALAAVGGVAAIFSASRKRRR